MGHYLILVEGYGAHHNADYEWDAEKKAKEFVKALAEHGHNIVVAEFKNIGQCEYLHNQPATEQMPVAEAGVSEQASAS